MATATLTEQHRIQVDDIDGTTVTYVVTNCPDYGHAASHGTLIVDIAEVIEDECPACFQPLDVPVAELEWDDGYPQLTCGVIGTESLVEVQS